MGGASIWHWIVVGLIVVLLFGRGKISEMMGDVAKGIKAFKKGMSEDDTASTTTTTTTTAATDNSGAETVRTIEHQPAGATTTTAATTDRRVG
jgi:sec-independent protein translocase protein TatA